MTGLPHRAMQAALLVPPLVSPVAVLFLVLGGSFFLWLVVVVSPWHLLLLCSIFVLMHWQQLTTESQRGRPRTGSRTAYCPSPTGATAVQLTQPATAVISSLFACWLAMEDAAVNRLATSITQLTLCQVTTDEIDAATKLLDKACQKLRDIPFTTSMELHFGQLHNFCQL